jgi:hypothetical protein
LCAAGAANKKAARVGRLIFEGLPTEAALAAKVGGARRDRTADLLHAMQALSQLSYGPNS